MKLEKFTGHPFVDAGLAGGAALLEIEDNKQIEQPADLTGEKILRAMDLALSLFYRKAKRDSKKEERPFFNFLLQEVLPGSSWDQVNSGANVSDSKQRKFDEYVTRIRQTISSPPIGRCFLTGSDAHVWVSKSEVPMLSSSAERPNCYPNLNHGLAMNGYLALSVLLSPLGIHKTVNEKGKGGQCLIYHSTNWRFMVEAAHFNIRRLRACLLANAIEDYWGHHRKIFPCGVWKNALQNALLVASKIPDGERPQLVVWHFNASNQSCSYENVELTDSFLILNKQRRVETTAFRDLPYCSDRVSCLILQGKSIVQASLKIDVSAKKEKYSLFPGWPLQRLYALQVLAMSESLLNTIEIAAAHLAEDSAATDYCLFQRPRIEVLAQRYKLPSEICAQFSDYHNLWQDYLRAALAWKARGNDFPSRQSAASTPGAIQQLIEDVTPRLLEKFTAGRIAHRLSTRVPRAYRQSWLSLLHGGACTYDDFLAFNPLEEALEFGTYSRTHILCDYLIAYLIGNNHREDRMIEIDKNEFDIEELDELIFADESAEENL